MATTDTERYVRITLLTFEGGSWISKKILFREVDKTPGKTIASLLRISHSSLQRKLSSRDITRKQFDILFPKHGGDTDVEEWDLSLLVKIIFSLFSGCLNVQETSDLDTIRDVRNDVVCHARQPAIKEKEFGIYRRKLMTSIQGLASSIDNDTEQYADGLIIKLLGGPLDLQSSMDKLAQLCRNDEHMEDILASLSKVSDGLSRLAIRQTQIATGMNAKLDDILGGVQKLLSIGDDEQCRKDIPILDSQVGIIGKKADTVKLVEDILLKVLKSAVNKTDDPTNAENVKTAVEQFLEDIEARDAHAVSANLGSIILNIQCLNLHGLEHMLRWFISSNNEFRLYGIEQAISDMFQEQFKVVLSLSQNTMDILLAWINKKCQGKDDNTFKTDISLGIQCQSADSVSQVLHYLHSGPAANRLNQLSEALSEVVDDRVRVELKVDVEKFSRALKDTQHMQDEMSMNNLSEAPQQPQFEIGATGFSFTTDDGLTDHKVSNIKDNDLKPEISKPLLEKDPRLSNIKEEQQDSSVADVKTEKKEDAASSEGEITDSDPIDSDYEEETAGSESEEVESDRFDTDYEDEEEALFELQDCRLELAEKALAGTNTVVFSPTGVGKIWVALHIIRNHLEDDTEGTRRVAFIVRTGALAMQLAGRIKEDLPQYQTMLLQGDTGTTKMLGECLRDYQLFCFTPQILVNSLEDGSVSSLTKFSLIIFDECHYTMGDRPQAVLMNKYLAEKNNNRRDEKLPQTRFHLDAELASAMFQKFLDKRQEAAVYITRFRLDAELASEMFQKCLAKRQEAAVYIIVGFTTTFGVGKSSTVVDALDYILRICARLDVTQLSTVKRCKEAMYKITTAPDQETIPMQPRDYDPGGDILRHAIQETEAILDEMTLLQPVLVDLVHVTRPNDKETQEYNKWTHTVMKAALRCVDDFDMSRNIAFCANYLNIYNQALEVNNLLQTADVVEFLAEKYRADSEQKDKLTLKEQTLLKNLKDVQRKLIKDARQQENPNVRILSERLRDMIENGGGGSRAMVFVKARATCQPLAKFLDRNLGDIVKTGVLYGKDHRGSDKGMAQAVQDEAVQKFRDGQYNVLVATSIGVEGIDIPECNMAISYNYTSNEITKVQMRGRVRKHGGTDVYMVHGKDPDKEGLSAYKIAMMQDAILKFDNLNNVYIERRVNFYQKEEMVKGRFKHEIEMAKKRRKTNNGDFEIRCKRCNTLACYISDVRICKMHHCVIDKEFVEKINIRFYKQQYVVDGLTKNRKMYCKKCPQDWGMIAERDGLDYMILKLAQFRLICTTNRSVHMYKKWIDVPYKVPEIDVVDFAKLLGDGEELLW